MAKNRLRIAWVIYAVTVCVLMTAVPVIDAQNLPAYRVDPFWPKQPLPNKWLIQGVPTMVTDKDDHIWVLNRPRDIMPDESGAATNPPRTDCCIAAPAVLEFDIEGNVLRAWGGPGHHPDWPAAGVARPGPGAEHNIMVDRENNVWISGSSQGDSIQKYTADGKFLWDFGHRAPRPPAPRPAENNQQTDVFPGGRVVTDNLADYLVPVNADIEQIEPLFLDLPDPHINPLGARGLGEIGIVGVAPAIANAVYHATGVRVRRLPITIEKLLPD